jgi:hypothetical protein
MQPLYYFKAKSDSRQKTGIKQKRPPKFEQYGEHQFHAVTWYGPRCELSRLDPFSPVPRRDCFALCQGIYWRHQNAGLRLKTAGKKIQEQVPAGTGSSSRHHL